MEKRNYYINFDGQEDHAQQYLLGMLADARLVTLSVVRPDFKTEQQAVRFLYRNCDKVLGATVQGIVGILSMDFFKSKHAKKQLLRS